MHAVYKMHTTKHIAQKKVPVNRNEDTFFCFIEVFRCTGKLKLSR
jgi:hypothetical protein